MAQQSGRNVQQPEYLNEKDVAEDKAVRGDDKEPEATPSQKRESERAITSVVEKAVNH